MSGGDRRKRPPHPMHRIDNEPRYYEGALSGHSNTTRHRNIYQPRHDTDTRCSVARRFDRRRESGESRQSLDELERNNDMRSELSAHDRESSARYIPPAPFSQRRLADDREGAAKEGRIHTSASPRHTTATNGGRPRSASIASQTAQNYMSNTSSRRSICESPAPLTSAASAPSRSSNSGASNDQLTDARQLPPRSPLTKDPGEQKIEEITASPLRMLSPMSSRFEQPKSGSETGSASDNDKEDYTSHIKKVLEDFSACTETRKDYEKVSRFQNAMSPKDATIQNKKRKFEKAQENYEVSLHQHYRMSRRLIQRVFVELFPTLPENPARAQGGPKETSTRVVSSSEEDTDSENGGNNATERPDSDNAMNKAANSLTLDQRKKLPDAETLEDMIRQIVTKVQAEQSTPELVTNRPATPPAQATHAAAAADFIRYDKLIEQQQAIISSLEAKLNVMEEVFQQKVDEMEKKRLRDSENVKKGLGEDLKGAFERRQMADKDVYSVLENHAVALGRHEMFVQDMCAIYSTIPAPNKNAMPKEPRSTTAAMVLTERRRQMSSNALHTPPIPSTDGAYDASAAATASAAASHSQANTNL